MRALRVFQEESLALLHWIKQSTQRAWSSPVEVRSALLGVTVVKRQQATWVRWCGDLPHYLTSYSQSVAAHRCGSGVSTRERVVEIVTGNKIKV